MDLLLNVVQNKEDIVTLVSGKKVGIEDGLLSIIEENSEEEDEKD